MSNKTTIVRGKKAQAAILLFGIVILFASIYFIFSPSDEGIQVIKFRSGGCAAVETRKTEKYEYEHIDELGYFGGFKGYLLKEVKKTEFSFSILKLAKDSQPKVSKQCPYLYNPNFFKQLRTSIEENIVNQDICPSPKTNPVRFEAFIDDKTYIEAACSKSKRCNISVHARKSNYTIVYELAAFREKINDWEEMYNAIKNIHKNIAPLRFCWRYL